MIYRLKFPFWSRQPVFHYHNIRYWLFPPGIIQHGKPEKNKFYNSKIFFDHYRQISTEKKTLFATFIQKHFLPKNAEKYKPPINGVLNYFKNHNNKSYLSILYDHTFQKKIIGTMSTRPLICYIGDFTKKNKINLYYVDFLCVHQKYRKKGYAPKIIYSHYVNHRAVSDNAIFLFKREGPNTLIVPLTIYNNYLFDIYYWDKLVTFDHLSIKTILITKQNIDLFVNVFERLQQSNFECIITPNINHLQHLIEKKEIFVCVTLINKVPYDCFVFRKTYTTYNGSNSLEAFASFKETDDSVFVLSFMCAISQIYQINKFQKLFIENISNNNIIIKKIMERYNYIWKGKCSYYFYNFGYRPFKSNDVFLLN